MQDLLGDYRRFFASIRRQLDSAGINIDGLPVSHVAFRTASIDEYHDCRSQLLALCSGEVENVWNGRPISKLLLRQPLQLADGIETSLIELIPTPHRDKYPMGLEHIGFVLGFSYDAFAAQHRSSMSGQLENGPWCCPWYIRLPDDSTAKFYRYSLKDVVELEGRTFLPPCGSATAAS